MTETNLYRNASFTTSTEDGSYLLPEDIASALSFLLNQRSGIVTTELTLRPQIHRLKKRES